MKKYLVGGAVRAELMGVTPNDFDYVVVGSSMEEMLEAGYDKVGKDFPVFLHPETREEYALARREKKTGVGHNGFSCDFAKDVSLIEDLFRRDFTMNSIAKDLVTGEFTDPYGGINDIRDKVIRHTNESAFADDPVRLLRAARFLSQFGSEWVIAPETKKLFKGGADELQHVPKDRIWKEMEKALSGKSPHLFFEALLGSGAFKEIDDLKDIPQRKDYHPEGCVLTHNQLVVKYAGDNGFSPLVVFGALCHDFGKAKMYRERGNLTGHEGAGVLIVEEFCKRVGAPKKFKQFAMACAKYHTHPHRSLELTPKTVYKLLEAFGVTRDQNASENFLDFLRVCECDYRGRGAPFNSAELIEHRQMEKFMHAFLSVDKKSFVLKVREQGLVGSKISFALKQEQLRAIHRVRP